MEPNAEACTQPPPSQLNLGSLLPTAQTCPKVTKGSIGPWFLSLFLLAKVAFQACSP